MKDIVAWTAMVTRYAQNSLSENAMEVFRRLLDEGVKINEVTLFGVISAHAQLGVFIYAKRIRDIAESYGFRDESSVLVRSALIDMYSKYDRSGEGDKGGQGRVCFLCHHTYLGEEVGEKIFEQPTHN